MKKIFILLVLIIFMVFIILSFHYRKDIAAIWKLISYEEYKYNYFCSKNNNNCVTAIIHDPPNIGGHPYKVYMVFGKNRLKLPLNNVNNIEYQVDTNILIKWETDYKCKIISDAEPIKKMNLSKDVDIKLIILSVQEFESYAEKYPVLTVDPYRDKNNPPLSHNL